MPSEEEPDGESVGSAARGRILPNRHLIRQCNKTGEIVGLGPRSRRPLVLLNFIRANRGRISHGELSRRLDVGQIKNTSLSYMGFATKTEGIRR